MSKKQAAKKATDAELKQGQGSVEATKKSSKTGAEQPVKSEKFDVPEEPGVYTQPVANVGFKVGYTKNLGNYESLRVDVDVHIPCYVNEIDQVFEFAKEWVEGKFEQVVAEIDENAADDD